MRLPVLSILIELLTVVNFEEQSIGFGSDSFFFFGGGGGGGSRSRLCSACVRFPCSFHIEYPK